MRCFPGVPSCEKYMIQASPVLACGIIEYLFACVRSAVFPDFQVSSARIPECSCVVLYKFEEVAKELEVEVDITLPKMEFKKRICQSKYYTEEVAKCLLEGILEEQREAREKREIKKFEERRLAREFELERLRAQLTNKLNEDELKAGNRIINLANVCILSEKRTAEVSEPVNKCRPLLTRSSDCEVKMKAGVCEGSVKAVAMGAQRVINPDNIGLGSFELKGDKGVANYEGLICGNI
ncbi:hypothetical protein TNCV_3358001 [Trichonephila clavipes]|nr:hypothetical protein TNCV_3358001 [Trichonephila clavipes]